MYIYIGTYIKIYIGIYLSVNLKIDRHSYDVYIYIYIYAAYLWRGQGALDYVDIDRVKGAPCAK